jgi:hypothetical protein
MDLEQFQNKTIFELITIFQRLQEERVIVRLTPHFLSLSLISSHPLALADLSTIRKLFSHDSQRRHHLSLLSALYGS